MWNKVVMITGASSGIGYGAAKHFAKLGCRLALQGRNAEGMQKTVDACVNEGLQEDKIISLLGDLTDDMVAKDIFNKAIDRFEQLDCLVNNAGIGVMGTVEDAGLDKYDLQMNINLRVHYHMSHLAMPYLKNSKGTIVNVSSVGGLRSFPNMVTYGMSKAAMDQMTRNCAIDFAKDGVRVNAVNPGVIVTEIHKRLGMDQDTYDKFLEHSKTTHALGRVGTVDDVARCIGFLAGEESSFITGVCIPIDGGRHAMCPR